MMIPKRQPGLTRLGVFKIEEILPFTLVGHKKNPRGPDRKPLPGATRRYLDYEVWMTSLRYQVFATKGTKCIACGLEGNFFALERHPNKQINASDRPHFNLYGFNDDGEEVLITKDHIIPRSKGGSDKLENLQTMCYSCNWLKSDGKIEQGNNSHVPDL